MFEDEIVYELVNGEIYTERQIYSYLAFNKEGAMVVSNHKCFSKHSETKFKVIDTLHLYVHKHNEPNSYLQPQNPEIIHLVEKA